MAKIIISIIFTLSSLVVFSQINFSSRIAIDSIDSKIYVLKNDSVFRIIQGLVIVKNIGGNWDAEILDIDGRSIENSKILKVILSRKTYLPEPRVFFEKFYQRLRL